MRLIPILTLLVVIGCASMSDIIIPELSKRTLRISSKIAGFEYQYEVCLKKFLGICRQKEMRVDSYDLTDLAVRKQLIDMGFVAKVREKVLP